MILRIIEIKIYSSDSTELSYFCLGAFDFLEDQGRLTLGALASAIRDRKGFSTIRAFVNATRLMEVWKNIILGIRIMLSRLPGLVRIGGCPRSRFCTLE
jgi:hypothetical protein